MEQVLANIGYFLELWMIQIYLSLTWDTKFCFGRFSCFLFVWNGLVATAVNTDILPKPCIWTTYVFLVIYFKRRFHKGFKEHVARFGIALSGVLVTEFAAGLIGLFLRDYIAKDEIMLVTINCISVCMAGIVWLLVKRWKPMKQPDANYGKFFGVALICLIVFVLTVLNYFITHAIHIVYAIIIAAVIAVFYWYFNKVQKVENKLKQQEQEMDVRRVYGKVYEESIKDIRRKQHDFQNQLTAIYGTHHVAASLEELVDIQKEYCVGLQEDSRYDGILLKCNESVVAGFLYSKCVACEEQGITVDYDIAVDKLECRVLLHELIEILGILLDNACEKELENVLQGNNIELGSKNTKQDKSIESDAENILQGISVESMMENTGQGRSVELEWENNCQGNNIELRLYEYDTGIELSVGNASEYVTAEEIELIFCNGYSTKGSKRGLGLARVKQLADKYGLEIQVMNEKRKTNWIVFTIFIDKEIRTTEKEPELSVGND